jgi:hypothetical protein
MNDGKFELVVLKNIDLTIFAKIITGNIPLESGDVEIISTDRANIKLHSPVKFHVKVLVEKQSECLSNYSIPQ